MTLRTRLLIAFLGLALVPTAILAAFTLDQLGRSIALWSPRGVELTLQSAVEVGKTALARMEATVLAQADDWSRALPAEPLTPATRTAIRAGIHAAGTDFMQLYRRDSTGWVLEEEVLPEGVLSPAPLDLSKHLDPALQSNRVVRSAAGALAAVAPIEGPYALVAGMRVPPDFFESAERIGSGAALYRRFGVVRDLSRTYTLLLVAVLVLALGSAALFAATRLARGMTRPLRDLETALTQVAAGNLETRVTPGGARELRHLGRSFNAMTERLAEARSAVQEAEREAAWREVARRLAHEFKNILTPMSLSLHRLQRRSGAVAETERVAVAESLSALGRGVDQMARLTEQFSQFARLPEPRLESTDLSEIARAAVSLHEHEGVAVEVSAPERLAVQGDSLLLSRAIHNLVLNACEASPQGTRVTVQVRPEGENAVLEVLDRGPGVASEVREHLFEPYVSTKRRGSGLGLSLVRDIATQHGGSIVLEDREGGGTRARLNLPRAMEASR